MTRRVSGAIVVLTLLMAPPAARAQANNECDVPGEEPNVIVGGIIDKVRHGAIGDVTAFTIGTTSCNVGTCWLNWFFQTADHPVIGQNMFRLKDGRFEQIGQAWVKHAFAAVAEDLCSDDCIPPPDWHHLGVNCSDPYNAFTNGYQGGLGPKSEVNVADGTHLEPFSTEGQDGDAIYKRLQVHNADLDPTLNLDPHYYVEGQYVTADDTAAGNGFNNVSYREARVFGSPGNFDFTLVGPTVQQRAAVHAWRANDPAVQVRNVGAQYVVAHKVTDLGGGLWHYEYAVQNVISQHAAQAFRVPIPHGIAISNLGFHDVDYHSGELYAGTDWTAAVDTSSSPHAIVWATETYAENPNANALRWGTLYNFRFDADWPPGPAALTIVPFLPGGNAWIWTAEGPERCGDDFCDTDESETSCATDCPFAGIAGEVPEHAPLTITPLLTGDLKLDWSDSCVPSDLDYEVYEGAIGDYASHAARLCTTQGATTATFTPAVGDRYYLIVPHNGQREGSYGRITGGGERPQGRPACLPQSTESCED
jgi:hypothetical protein